MFITVVRLALKAGTTLAEISKIYEEHSKSHPEIRGLLTKYYIFGDGKGGAVYVWKSRADAERLFTTDWLTTMGARYGSKPEIEWLENPMTVDNSFEQYQTLAMGLGP